MEAGGRLKVGIPSLEDLKEETEQGRPVVVFLTNASLYPNNIARVYKRPFTYTFHSLVVTGVTKDEVFVNDPYWGEEGGEKAYPSDEFLYAVHASTLGDVDNGCFVKVRKRN